MTIVNKQTGESLSFEARVLLQSRIIGTDKFKTIAFLDLQILKFDNKLYKQIVESITKTVLP